MNLLKIKEYLQDNQELVIEKIVEAMKEAEGFDSSWRTDLLIDSDLEPWTTEMMGQNSFSSSVWDGSAFVIASGDGWSVGADGYDYDFEETMKAQDNYNEIKVAFDEQDEDSDDYEYQLIDFVNKFYPETIKKMDADQRNYIINDEFTETASSKYDDALERIDIEIANEEERKAHEAWEEEQRRLERESYQEK